MTAEIVNLRRVRKRAQRRANEKVADGNRIVHGLTKTERMFVRQEAERRDRALDGSRLVRETPDAASDE